MVLLELHADAESVKHSLPEEEICPIVHQPLPLPRVRVLNHLLQNAPLLQLVGLAFSVLYKEVKLLEIIDLLLP